MEEEKIIEISKEAYVLSQQVSKLQEVINKGDTAIRGYPSYAKNYNSLLQKTRKILAVDPIILHTISHLTEFEPNMEHCCAKEFEEIKANLSMIEAALFSFFQFHFPKKEKEKMGF